MYAICQKNSNVFTDLLKHGADVNAVDEQGNTPLIHAAIKGEKGMIEKLLEKGANANARANDGFTPLRHAIRSGKGECVELLRKHGGVK